MIKYAQAKRNKPWVMICDSSFGQAARLSRRGRIRCSWDVDKGFWFRSPDEFDVWMVGMFLRDAYFQSRGLRVVRNTWWRRLYWSWMTFWTGGWTSNLRARLLWLINGLMDRLEKSWR